MVIKIKHIRYYIFLIALVGFTACEDVIEIDVPEGKTRLVVEGMITDREELQTVKLKYTAPYFSNQPTPVVQEAAVYITDDQGQKITLTETAPGVYQHEFAGIYGRSYQLHIETAQGEQYHSLKETMMPVPPIDTIYATFEKASINNEEEGYYVAINSTDPADTVNFYRWRYYVNGQLQNEPEDLFFGNDRLIDGLDGIMVNFYRDPLLPDDVAIVEQMSISEDAYNFLNLLYQQTVSGGAQFSPPPAPIKGNIINTKDGDYALGFFMVTAITTAEIVIKEGM